MKNKTKFWLLTTALVALSSCTSEEDLYDPAKEAELRKAEYEEAFFKRYGEIAPGHDWGFGASAISRAANKPVEPADLTDAEIERVENWFKANQNPTSIDIKWSDFFAQQVSKSHKGMSQMYAISTIGNNKHINFSNGNGNGNGNKNILIQNINLAGFGFTTSWDSGNPLRPNYSIQYIDGAYYVGFDFESLANNEKQTEAPDGYYSDWIIKISPANNYEGAKRVFAEDLGKIGDLDFNDVVFDAVILDGEALITLQAAGGTLPLYIGKQSDNYEVHQLFGVSTSTMVNTYAGRHQEKAPIIFRLSGYSDIIDIPINVDFNGYMSVLTANEGKAPGKICVPNTTTDWSNENISIEDTYPKFKDYVYYIDIIWWE